MQCTRS